MQFISNTSAVMLQQCIHLREGKKKNVLRLTAFRCTSVFFKTTVPVATMIPGTVFLLVMGPDV